MSLHDAAQHIAAHGRGDDKVLVHMTPDEVKSLNDLAMAHGGHLTINPHTGLPEAGFLSSLLPMVAGAALTGLSGGAINPLTAGLIVGGGSYLMNPNKGLMGGLMAGLGAYGGAGLGQALAQQGMEQVAGKQMLENEVAKNTAEMSSNLPSSGVTPRLAPGTVLPYGTGLSGEMASGDMVAKLTAPQYGAGMSSAQLNAGLAAQSIPERLSTMGEGIKSLGTEGGVSNLISNMGGGFKAAGTAASALSPAIADSMKVTPPPAPTPDKDMGQRYTFSPNPSAPQPAPDVPTYDQMLTQQGNFGRQQNYFPNQGYTRVSPEQAKSIYGFAGGGPVEQMSNAATLGENTMYPMANMRTSAFATPYQAPQSINMLAPSGGGTVDQMSGEPNMQGTRLAEGGVAKYGFGGFIGDTLSDMGSSLGHMFKGGDSSGWAQLEAAMGGKPKQDAMEAAGYKYNPQTQQYQQMATGGISDAHYNLGGYSDGGRLLRGPGDGVSDSIPATIGHKQPARLADGEFVVPARIVSELGNGSTEAGARKLYAMMDRVQAARKKTVGKNGVAHNSRADKYLPA